MAQVLVGGTSLQEADRNALRTYANLDHPEGDEGKNTLLKQKVEMTGQKAVVPSKSRRSFYKQPTSGSKQKPVS